MFLKNSQIAAYQSLKDPNGFQDSLGSTVRGTGMGRVGGWHFMQDGKFISTLKRQDSQVRQMSRITILTDW